VVLQSLIPIALGPRVSRSAIVSRRRLAAGVVIDPTPIRISAAAVRPLIGWALYTLFLWPSPAGCAVGMQAGFAGLVLLSFLMRARTGRDSCWCRP